MTSPGTEKGALHDCIYVSYIYLTLVGTQIPLQSCGFIDLNEELILQVFYTKTEHSSFFTWSIIPYSILTLGLCVMPCLFIFSYSFI